MRERNGSGPAFRTVWRALFIDHLISKGFHHFDSVPYVGSISLSIFQPLSIQFSGLSKEIQVYFLVIKLQQQTPPLVKKLSKADLLVFVYSANYKPATVLNGFFFSWFVCKDATHFTAFANR